MRQLHLPFPERDHHDLVEIRDRIAARYLPALSPLPAIAWSSRDRQTMLASFEPEVGPHGAIIVSRLLNRADVPGYFMEYLVYHELLHGALGTIRRGRQDVYHHRLFRVRERQFPHYAEAVAWERDHLHRIIP